MKRYEFITSDHTGSKRGYICVDSQYAESDYFEIPTSIMMEHAKIARKKWQILKYLRDKGCTHYTETFIQGVPGKGYSTQYYYYIEYNGYKEIEDES